MEEYLSIGEVARLKKVTIKALRYYEKIGIFSPAYINEETGYRYYSIEQMVILDLILACLELGIPLKQFPNYMDKDGVLDINQILQDGIHVAEQEITRIRRTTDKLKNMSRHLEESEKFLVRGSSRIRFLPARYLLLKPMQELYPGQREYISALTELYYRMEDEQYTNLYKQGLLYQIQEKRPRCYTYNEVEKPENPQGIYILPAGHFHCHYMHCDHGATWLTCAEPFLQSGLENGAVLLQERYERRFLKEPCWEVQVECDATNQVTI